MNFLSRLTLLSCATLLLSATANAHDPKEHMKDAQSPDCAAMQDMDHEKMDMEDPVMVAMMSQCMSSMAHAEPTEVVVEESESHADHSHNDATTSTATAAAAAAAEHQH